MPNTREKLTTKDKEPNQADFPACRYNPGVCCNPTMRNCDECGWNPEVANARLKRFCIAHKMQLPEEKSDKLT